MSRRFVSAMALVASVIPMSGFAFDVAGVKSGMTFEEVQRQLGKQASAPLELPSGAVTLHYSDGLSVSLCRGVVTTVDQSYPTNFSAINNVMHTFTTTFGQPKFVSADTTQTGETELKLTRLYWIPRKDETVTVLIGSYSASDILSAEYSVKNPCDGKS